MPYHTGPDKTELTELAREAVRNFRALLPALNSYARVLTGNQKVRVVISNKTPSTDGVQIFYRPPTELGKKYPHERMLCDKRDATSWLQKCPSCAQREIIMADILHEISHIAYGTMVPTDDLQRSKFLNEAVLHGNAEGIKKRIESIPLMHKYNWMALSHAVSPYFQLLVNGMEDVRVNQRMFAARRGTYPMFVASERHLMEKGFEYKDDATGAIETRVWKDTPLDSQALVAVYLQGMGILEPHYLADTVYAAFQDRQLNFLLDDIKGLKSAQGTVNLAFKVLVRLRELGFLLEPEERPAPEPETNPESGDKNNDNSDKDSAMEPPEEGPGVPETEDGGGGEDSTPGDGEPGGDSTDSSDGSGSVSDDAGAGSPGDDKDDSESSNGDSTGDSAGQGRSDGGDPGDAGGSDSDVGSDDSDDHANGSEVPSEGMAEDAGDHRGTGGSISSDSDDNEGELSNDESRGSGESGEDLGDTDDEDTGDDLNGDLELPSGDVDRDRREASPAGDDDRRKKANAGGEGSDSEGSSDSSSAEASRPEWGTAEEAAQYLEQALGHTSPSKENDKLDLCSQAMLEELVKVAISQSEHFDEPGQNVSGIALADYKDGWRKPGNPERYLRSPFPDTSGLIKEYMPSESILGPVLLKMRRVFQDNAKGGKQVNQTSGRINSRALGKRAWSGDDRLFSQRIKVAKKDYFTVIGLDVSGSTNTELDDRTGLVLDLIKRAAMAQAELLHRLNIPFAIFAHTGQYATGEEFYGIGMMDVAIFPVKTADQPWDQAAKQRLAELRSYSANLDGHTLEFYRKQLDANVKHKETEGILMYYTDGAMPLENYEEELEILQREIATCKRKGYTEMAVAIGTDSPLTHGFDTVRIDGEADLIKVVTHLEKRLLQG